MTLGQLVFARSALTKLLNADLDCKLSWRLRKLVGAVDAELQHHEQERIRLVVKYGATDDKGNTNVKPDQFKEFAMELGELNNINVEFQFEPIPLANLEGVKMSAAEMASIEQFICE